MIHFENTLRAGIGEHGSRAQPLRRSSDQGELQQLVRELVAAGAPGAVARIQDEGGVEQVASGVADLRTGRAMQPHLHFRAGSVTKSFVATVVLQLVADGKLSLSDSVDRWLPGVLSYGDQINIRQLLNHTSGVPHNAPILWRSLYGSPDGRFRTWTPPAQVALVADLPPLFPAGTAWAYTNVGYTLLGLIIEAATGTRLGTQISRRILRPLGLRDTSFPVAGTGIPSPMSRGYSLPLSPQLDAVDGPLIDFTAQNPSYAWAAGGLISNLRDLERFFRGLLGGELLPSQLLSEMLTTVPVPRASLPLPLFDRNGLGIIETDTPSGPLVGAAGGIPGFLTVVFSTPDGRRQLGAMINIGDRAPGPVVEAFLRTLRILGLRLHS
jgi:D-alanyl-D-alanine carboxypeptidase